MKRVFEPSDYYPFWEGPCWIRITFRFKGQEKRERGSSFAVEGVWRGAPAPDVANWATLEGETKEQDGERELWLLHYQERHALPRRAMSESLGRRKGEW